MYSTASTMPAARLQYNHMSAAAPISEVLHGRQTGAGRGRRIFNPLSTSSYKMNKVDIILDGYKMMKIGMLLVDFKKLEEQTCVF